jgi:hypothetical protein
VKNPLNIPLFSENTQELRFFDQNLNPIQTINFRQKLGLIKMAYTEDLQQVWLLDGSMKRLIQYNFRQGNVINSFPMDFDFEEICDMLVFDNRLFLLKEDSLLIYNFRSEKILEIPVVDAKRFRRENFDILIVCKNTVQKLENNTLKIIFNAPDSQIVDKNSSSYFAIKGNKLYLYKIVVDQ